VVDGPGDYVVYAHQGRCGANEESLLWHESLTYLPESNSCICPAGQQLNYGGRSQKNRTFGWSF
jgi:hypothetical protein